MPNLVTAIPMVSVIGVNAVIAQCTGPGPPLILMAGNPETDSDRASLHARLGSSPSALTLGYRHPTTLCTRAVTDVQPPPEKQATGRRDCAKCLAVSDTLVDHDSCRFTAGPITARGGLTISFFRSSDLAERSVHAGMCDGGSLILIVITQ